jgi:hypothetical protein
VRRPAHPPECGSIESSHTSISYAVGSRDPALPFVINPDNFNVAGGDVLADGNLVAFSLSGDVWAAEEDVVGCVILFRVGTCRP